MKQFNRRHALIAGLGASVVAVGALGVWAGISRPAPRPGNGYAHLGRGIDDVTLIDESGAGHAWRDLNGRPRALFFGFTHCAVVCPVTVWELNDALDKIGAPANTVTIQFVTIDPQRDSAATLHAYFSGFGGRVKAYTGTAQAIARVAGAFEVVYRRSGEGADYSMDHTATVFLLDGAGRVADVIGFGSPHDVTQARLRALVGAPPQAPPQT